MSVQPSPRSPISITNDDCDKEQDPWLEPVHRPLGEDLLGHR